MSEKRNKIFPRIFPGIIFFAGGIYVWGGIILNPDGVEYALYGMSLKQSFVMLSAFYFLGLGSLLTGSILFLALNYGLKANIFRDLFSDHKKLLYVFLILSLISPPATWYLAGIGGIFAAGLAVITGFISLTGTFLISEGIGIFLSERIKPLQFKEKSFGYWRLTFISLLFVFMTALIGKMVLGGIPHVGDGVIQLLQAKMYSMGEAFTGVPENIEFFFDTFMVSLNGRWFSQYPPGSALLLVPGLIYGRPELVNPLISGITVMIFGLILKELRLSLWWTLLMIFSPFVIFMSGSFMSHPAAMMWGAFSLWAFLKSGRENSRWMFLWGLSAGLMFMTRPYDAVCFNLPLIIMAFRKRIGMGIIFALLGAVIGSVPFFTVNYLATGSFLTSGYQAAWDGASGLFYGKSPWGPPHTMQLGLMHLLNLLSGLNRMLFETPVPALLGVLLWIFYKEDKGWKEWAGFSAGFLSFAGYIFYFYVDEVFGPRFAYTSVFPLLLISALGFRSYYLYLRHTGCPRESALWRFFTGGILLMSVWLVISLPARWDYYSGNYRDVSPDFIQKIEQSGINNAIVFLDDYPSTDRHARLYSLGFSNREAWYYSWRLSDEAVFKALSMFNISQDSGFGGVVSLPEFGSALNRFWGNPRALPDPAEDTVKPFIPLKQGWIYVNPHLDQNDIIFARDFGKHNEVLCKKYPGRSYYRIEMTDSGFVLNNIKF